MERESFEDEEVADILNKNFISIKVDREERPDVDSIYMTFCQNLTGHGGWPLTIIMTPDKNPFFTGTYFPKIAKYGRMGIIDVLNQIVLKWEENRSDLEKYSEEITESIKNIEITKEKQNIEEDIFDEAFDIYANTYDSTYGGFGEEPKFSIPHNLYFLLRYWKHTKNDKALNMALYTLDSMYKGGLFDHVGFGFSRYSTDKKWLVPHFEKMLYDNALLSIAYIEAYQITKKELYKEICEKIFTYIIRDMTSEEGCFYSAEDADSEGEEGKFYVWGLDEIKNILGEEDTTVYAKYYDITQKGNFEGKNIPNLINQDIWEIENNEGLKYKLEECRETLFNYRKKRIHPHKDDKILTSWNGLMVAALAKGGKILQNDKYIDYAKKCIDFIFKNLVDKNGRLLARYRDKESAYLAYLDDYAFLTWGLLELYEATFDEDYLRKSEVLMKDMIHYFWDKEEGGFYLYGNDSEELILRPKEIYDGAIPSGNSVAALNMIKLRRLLKHDYLEEKIEDLFSLFGKEVKNYPIAYSYFLMAFLFRAKGTKEISIAGEKNNKDTKAILIEINKRFLPDLIISVKEDKDKILDNKSTAYFCQDFICNKPTNELEKIISLLEN